MSLGLIKLSYLAYRFLSPSELLHLWFEHLGPHSLRWELELAKKLW